MGTSILVTPSYEDPYHTSWYSVVPLPYFLACLGSSFQEMTGWLVAHPTTFLRPLSEFHMPRVAHTVACVASWLLQEELQMMLVARPHPSILVAPSASIIDLRTMSRKTY